MLPKLLHAAFFVLFLALPTHADLPDFDPRRSIPLGHRRLYSAIVGIGGLAACLGCVFLAAAAPDWVGQCPRFFLFFGGPLVTLAFARVVGHALTGDDRYPRR